MAIRNDGRPGKLITSIGGGTVSKEVSQKVAREADARGTPDGYLEPKELDNYIAKLPKGSTARAQAVEVRASLFTPLMPGVIPGAPARPDLLAAMALRDRLETFARTTPLPPSSAMGGTTVNAIGLVNKVNGLLTSSPPISPAMGTALTSFLSNLATSLEKGPVDAGTLSKAIESAGQQLRSLSANVSAPTAAAPSVGAGSVTLPNVQLADFLLGESSVKQVQDLGKPLDATNRALVSSMSTLFSKLPPIAPVEFVMPVAMTFTDPQSGLKIDISKSAKLSVDSHGVYTLTPPDVRVVTNGATVESHNAKLVLGREQDLISLGNSFVTLDDGGHGELSNLAVSATASGATAMTADAISLDLTTGKVTGTGLNITRNASTDTTSASVESLHSERAGRTLDTTGVNVAVANGALTASGGTTSASSEGLTLKASSFQLNLDPGPSGRGKLQTTDLHVENPASGLLIDARNATLSTSRSANGSSTVDVVLDGATSKVGVGRGELQSSGAISLKFGTNPNGVVTNFTAVGSNLKFQGGQTEVQLGGTAAGAPADPQARPVRLTGTASANGTLESLQAESADLRWKQGAVETHATGATVAINSLTGNPTAKVRASTVDVDFGDRGLKAASQDLDCTLQLNAAGQATGVSLVGRGGSLQGPFGALSSNGKFSVDGGFSNGALTEARLSTDATTKSTWAQGAKTADFTGLNVDARTATNGTAVAASAASVTARDGSGRTAQGTNVSVAGVSDGSSRLVSGTAQAASAQGVTSTGANLSGTGLGLTWSPEAVKATALTGDFRSTDGLTLSGKGLVVAGAYADGKPVAMAGTLDSVHVAKNSTSADLNGATVAATSDAAAGTAQFSVTAASGTLAGPGWAATGKQFTLQGSQRPDGETWAASGENVTMLGSFDNGHPVALNLAQVSLAQKRTGEVSQTEVRLGQGTSFQVNGVSVELPKGATTQDSTLVINSTGRTISALDLSMPGQVKAQVDDRGSLLLSGINATAAQNAGASALQLGVAQGQVTAKLNTNGTAGIGFSGLSAHQQVGADGRVQFSVGVKDLDAALVDNLKGTLGLTAVGAQVTFTADQVLRARAGITKLSIEQGDVTVKSVSADGQPTDVHLEIGADGKFQSAGARMGGDLQIIKGDADLTLASGSEGALRRNADGSVELTAQHFGLNGQKGTIRVAAAADADVLLNANGDVVVKNLSGKLGVTAGDASLNVDIGSLKNALATYQMGDFVNKDTYLALRPVTGSDGSIHMSGSVNMQKGALKAKLEFHDLKQLEAMAHVTPNELTLLLGDRTKDSKGWVKVSAMGKALTAEGSYLQARITYSPMNFSRLNDALLRMANQKDVVGVTPWLSIDPVGLKASVHAPQSSPVVADLTLTLGTDRGVYVPDGSDPYGSAGVMMKVGARFGERRNEVSAFAGMLPGSTMNFTVDHGDLRVAGLKVDRLSLPTTAVGGLETKINDVSVQVGVFQNLAKLTSTPMFIRENYANGLFGSVSTPVGKNGQFMVTASGGKDDSGKTGYAVAGVFQLTF